MYFVSTSRILVHFLSSQHVLPKYVVPHLLSPTTSHAPTRSPGPSSTRNTEMHMIECAKQVPEQRERRIGNVRRRPSQVLVKPWWSAGVLVELLRALSGAMPIDGALWASSLDDIYWAASLQEQTPRKRSQSTTNQPLTRVKTRAHPAPSSSKVLSNSTISPVAASTWPSGHDGSRPMSRAGRA